MEPNPAVKSDMLRYNLPEEGETQNIKRERKRVLTLTFQLNRSPCQVPGVI